MRMMKYCTMYGDSWLLQRHMLLAELPSISWQARPVGTKSSITIIHATDYPQTIVKAKNQCNVGDYRNSVTRIWPDARPGFPAVTHIRSDLRVSRPDPVPYISSSSILQCGSDSWTSFVWIV